MSVQNDNQNNSSFDVSAILMSIKSQIELIINELNKNNELSNKEKINNLNKKSTERSQLNKDSTDTTDDINKTGFSKRINFVKKIHNEKQKIKELINQPNQLLPEKTEKKRISINKGSDDFEFLNDQNNTSEMDTLMTIQVHQNAQFNTNFLSNFVGDSIENSQNKQIDQNRISQNIKNIKNKSLNIIKTNDMSRRCSKNSSRVSSNRNINEDEIINHEESFLDEKCEDETKPKIFIVSNQNESDNFNFSEKILNEDSIQISDKSDDNSIDSDESLHDSFIEKMAEDNESGSNSQKTSDRNNNGGLFGFLNKQYSVPLVDAKKDIKETKMKSSKSIIKVNLEMNQKELKLFNAKVFELNNYPKCVFMLNDRLDIIQYNAKVCQFLLYDKFELMEKSLTSIMKLNNVNDSTNVIDQMDELFERQEFIGDTENQKENMEIVIQDKNFSSINFAVQINFQTQKDKNNEIKLNLILYLDQIEMNEKHQSIDPNNIFYIVYSLIILMIIVKLMFQVPYDLAFGDEQLFNQNQYFDRVVLVIFCFDILLNFLLAQEDEDGKLVFDIKSIVLNQTSTSFIMDVIATIPFDMLIDNVDINTSILKGIKIIRFIKLIKILKISKLMNLRNKKIKELIGSELIAQIKSSSGFFDLMRQNLYILMCSHQFTIIFFYVKCNFIEVDPLDQSWLKTQQNISSDDGNFIMQMRLLSEAVKTALGLGSGAQNMSNPLEIGIQISWMFLGLSMFGYGIGNISSYLNYMNHTEIEYHDTKNQFKEICDKYSVDNNISKLIFTEVDTQYRNFSESNLQNKSKVLSNTVFTQLEAFIYEEFINSFNLLSKLNISIIRYLKNNIHAHVGKFKLLKGSNMNEIYFITRGKLSLQDEKMKLINTFINDEIYGFGEFLHQLQLKQTFNLEEKLETMAKDVDDDQVFHTKEYENSIRDLKTLICTIVKEYYNQPKQEVTMDLEIFKKNKGVDINQEMTNEYLPISSDDLHQFSIKQEVVEGILFNEFDSFILIWRHWRRQMQIISQEMEVEMRETLRKFEKSRIPAIMMTESGDVYEVNHQLMHKERSWVKKLYNSNFLTNLRQEKYTKVKVTEVKNLEVGKEYKMTFGNIKKYFKISEIEFKSIRSTTDMINMKSLIKLSSKKGRNTKDLDEEKISSLNKNDNINGENNIIKYQNLKKCLIEVQIIQFTIDDQIRV